MFFNRIYGVGIHSHYTTVNFDETGMYAVRMYVDIIPVDVNKNLN